MPRKIIFVILSLLALLLVACEPGAAEPTAPATLPPPTVHSQEPRAVANAISTLSEELGVDSQEIEVVSFEEREWPDGCLGLGGPDEICTQAIVPGWLVILRAEGQQYEVRTDATGSTVRWQPA
ncbi:MAG TPA: hypothetical protein VF177_11430 [Anaerolineae bacterium]